MASEKHPRSIPVVMALSVLCGAVVGGGLGVVVLPGLAAGLAIGGAMMGGAIGAAVFLFAGADK